MWVGSLRHKILILAYVWNSIYDMQYKMHNLSLTVDIFLIYMYPCKRTSSRQFRTVNIVCELFELWSAHKISWGGYNQRAINCGILLKISTLHVSMEHIH